MTGIIVSVPPTVEVPPGNNANNPQSLPPVTYQYAVLNIPQTWTAKQTFPLGMISVNFSDIIGFNAGNINFTQSGTGAISRPVQSKLQDVVSVKDFGALGDGVSNDTAAMQAAHNTGRVVYYPKGTYAFTTLTIAQGGIIGDSMALTNLVTTSLGSADVITYTGTGGIATAFPPVFEKFLLQTSGVKTAGTGLKFAPSSGEIAYASIRQVQIVNLPTSIWFVAANNWVVSECKIELYTVIGILVDNTNAADSGDACITNCVINTSVAGTVGVQQMASGGLKIIGNKFNGGAIGYKLAFNGATNTGDLMITGNSFENMANQSILLSRVSGVNTFGQITITGNQFALCSMHIYAGSPIYDLTIAGNVFRLPASGFGVYLDTGVDNFNVSANTIRGSGSGTGVFWTGCTNGLISQNQIMACATNVTPGSGSVIVTGNPTFGASQTIPTPNITSPIITDGILTINGINAPRINIIPSTGATKFGQIYQLGDSLNFGETVGTLYMSISTTTGAVAFSGLSFGYGTGAGGTVTQATSKATGVTLNKASGQITMNAAALAAGTIVSFVLTDSAIAATDVLILNHISGGTPGSYSLNARCAAGSATIDVRNNTAGSLSEAIVIQFALIKAVNA